MRRVDAGIAAVIAATILGTVPAVGGYSNTTTDSVHASAPESGDFSTVGIVTQVTGGTFAVADGKSAAQALEVGQGVVSGDRIWVEQGGLVRLTDTEGGRITVAGPASVEFVRRGRLHAVARIFKGAVKFRAAEGQTMHFENAFVAGTVAGEGAVWTSGDTVQVLGLTGDVKAWHPHLVQAAVLVTPGFFTESSLHFKHLQPKIPVRVDGEHFEHFLSRFEETHAPLENAEEQKRGLAALVGSGSASEELVAQAVPAPRSAAALSEPKSAEVMRRLQAHISGKDYEEQDEVPLAAPGPRYNAYGQRVKSRNPAAERHTPTWQVVKQARGPQKMQKMDDEQRSLLEKLSKQPKVQEAGETE
ncbi:MAG: hypothetical protein HY074_14350 [Deltaproteobacteria bacterium]|nr:hypothetical protein [Deltaproteobacteria bacterium]